MNFSQCVCVCLGIRSTKLQISKSTPRGDILFVKKSLFKNYNKRLVWTTALFSGCCDITKQLIRISLKHIFEQIIFLFETKITCYSQYSAHKCSFRSQYSLVKLFKFKKEKNRKKHNRMNTTQQNETAFKILSIINYTM